MKYRFPDEESALESPIMSLNSKTEFITIIAVVLLVVSTAADFIFGPIVILSARSIGLRGICT